jgi:riboflavin synthase
VEELRERSFHDRAHRLKRLRLCVGFASITQVFTGIIEETGEVQSITVGPKSIQLAVRARSLARELKIGDSVAVNGCCLTAVQISGPLGRKIVAFDLLRETWQRTNFQVLERGSLVNLERPLRANGRLDGHFVTGHIDGTGRIKRWERNGSDHVLDVATAPDLMRYMIEKGSVAIDGISLTVAAVRKKEFRVWIIPHTHDVTNLRARKVGDAVNLEADLLGKYVDRFVTKTIARAIEKIGAVNRT